MNKPQGGIAVAHGIDLVDVARVADLLRSHPERALERIFTPDEQAYCVGKKRQDEHLAARFAAKEAVLKALGTGWAQGLSWTDVEVTRDEAGAPGVRLHNLAKQRAEELGITSWLLSLSHTHTQAMASAIALRTV